MNRFIYTKEMIEYVKKIAPGRYNDEITELFNKKFGLNKTVKQINSMKKNYGITSGKLPKRFSSKLLNREQDAYLRENVKGRSNQELADMLNKKFGLSLTAQQVNTYKSNRGLSSGLTGYFKKGHKPWNKGMKGLDIGGKETRFKKGQTPINYRAVGSERTNVEGYIEIKTADPRTWELKHRVMWEEHFGKIPEDYVVSFYDMNKENLKLENLFLLTKAENAQMNRCGLYSTNPELTKVGVALVRLNKKVREKERGYSNDELREFAKEAEKNKISHNTFIARVNRGWTLHDAVNLPLNSVPKRRRRS